MKRGRSPSYSPSSRRRGGARSSSRSRSRTPQKKPLVRNEYSRKEYDETLRTLHCKDCNVYLHDRDSMVGHLQGREHLMQQKRMRDNEVRLATGGRGLNDMLRPDHHSLDYDESYWHREDRARRGKVLLPEQEKFLDVNRVDTMRAKFDARKYDMGQYKFNEKEMHCSVCDVWTKSRHDMEAHMAGQNHKKKSAKVQRFQCNICVGIQVTCQETLDNHMMGKDHIKRVAERAKLMQEERGEKEADGMRDGRYKTGPTEMAKLTGNEREELNRLRKQVKILQGYVKEYREEKQRCVSEHGTQEVKELREKVKKCLEEHVRPAEFERRGIFCKREEGSDQPSTSSGVKGEFVKKEYENERRGGMHEETVKKEYENERRGGMHEETDYNFKTEEGEYLEQY